MMELEAEVAKPKEPNDGLHKKQVCSYNVSYLSIGSHSH